MSHRKCHSLLVLLASWHRYSFGHIALLCSLNRALQEAKITAQSATFDV